jgi:hypothetical protein
MSPAHSQPCCRGRLAHFWPRSTWTVLAVALLWPAAASDRLSAAESTIPSVGPASREQPRQADATRTPGVAAINSKVTWEPLTLVADLRDSLNELQWPFESTDRLAQNGPALTPEPADENAASEEVPAGKPERNPCYVSGPISAASVNIAPPEGKLPENVALKCHDVIATTPDPRMVGAWSAFEEHWAATCFCHRPLYFEEINAERYGYTPGYCIQPFVSAGRFLATIPALPYLMVAHPPCECVYSLGYYRPGSCVPYRWHRPAACVGAGLFEAAVAVGLVVLIP